MGPISGPDDEDERCWVQTVCSDVSNRLVQCGQSSWRQWAVGNISMNTNQSYHLITARPVQSSGQSEVRDHTWGVSGSPVGQHNVHRQSLGTGHS